MMFLALLVLAIGAVSANQVFAEPLDSVRTSASNYDGNSATIRMAWNYDASAADYVIGCVSCSPNFEKYTTGTAVTLHNVTPFPGDSYAMLYVISYDYEGYIIAAAQLVIDLGQ